MSELMQLLLAAGRSGIELALFTLLPVMVVMLSLMRLLESWGALDRMARAMAPLLRPFGIPGMGVFAMLQGLLVSFAAPMATLAMMNRDGTSDRHIAATFAMVLTLAQANVVFPMAAVGLNVGPVMGISVIGGLISGAAAWYVFGRHLSGASESEQPAEGPEPGADIPRGWFPVLQRAGREALEITFSAIPMLVLALVAVYLLRAWGAADVLDTGLAPILTAVGLDGSLALPLVTKYIGGGMAMMGVAMDFLEQGHTHIDAINQAAGLLIHPYDLLGVAVLMSAGRRVAGVARVAVCAAAVGVLFRTLAHLLLGL